MPHLKGSKGVLPDMTHARIIALTGALIAAGPTASASNCLAPERPFLPQSQTDMQTYANLIRADFEAYIADVQDYFRCLDEERARAFVEAHEVSADYARFIDAVR